MKFGRGITKGLVLLLLLVGAVLNCTRAAHKPPAANATVLKKGQGPPPHAPAHGYRAKTSHGVEIVFDSKLGVYVVVGLSNYYFYKGLYYRFNAGHWETAANLHGSWEVIAEYKVPPALRLGKNKGKGKRKQKAYGKK